MLSRLEFALLILYKRNRLLWSPYYIPHFQIIPFGNVIGPLIVWQMKKDMPFVDDQGKEALNFQITVSIAVFICFPLMFVLIGLLLLPLVLLGALVMTIIAGLKANNGETYRYPLALRLIT